MNATNDVNDMNDMNEQLNDEMTTVDRAITPPDVDVAAIARLGRGERRRRTGIVAAGAAAAAVLATVGVLAIVPGGDGAARQVEPADRPSGSAPVDAATPDVAAAPRIEGRTLRAGGTSYEFSQNAIASPQYAAGTTLATLRAEGRWHVVRMRDGRVVEYAEGPGTPSTSVDGELSSDGLTVAVREPGRGSATRVTLYDTHTTAPLGSVEVPRIEGVGDPSLVGVTGDRRAVWFRDNLGTFIWSPGSDPVPLTGLEGGFESYGGSWPGGFATDSADGADTVFGTIDDQGVWTETFRKPRAPGYSWGPSSDAWVFTGYSDADPSVYVEGPDRDATVLLPLEPGAYAEVVGWQSATDVVLDVTPETGSGSRLLCDVDALNCQPVLSDR